MYLANGHHISIFNDVHFQIIDPTLHYNTGSVGISRPLHNKGPPRGGPMLYAIWLFYGFAICYNTNFNTAIITFSTSAIKKCNGAICYKNIYKKHLKLVRHYRSFLSGFLST